MPYVRCQQKVREGPEEVTTNRIKELRTQAGLTLEELAALIPGASKQLIHRLESGKTKQRMTIRPLHLRNRQLDNLRSSQRRRFPPTFARWRLPWVST